VRGVAAALLFAVAALASLVWGGMLLSGWLDVRSLDLTLWGAASVLAGALAIAGAVLCYRQRELGASIAIAALVALTFSFVLVGPALGLAAAYLLSRARHEGEFSAR
jgi:hypothetical protein